MLYEIIVKVSRIFTKSKYNLLSGCRGNENKVLLPFSLTSPFFYVSAVQVF